MGRFSLRSFFSATDTGRGASQFGTTHLSNSVSHRVLMETFEPRLLLSADLFPIAGTISAPGEEDSYAITFAEPTRVSFDSLTPSELNWRLSGPGDVNVGSTLDRADGRSRNAPALLDVARGTYNLTVSGQEAQTGAYAFALNDLADDPELSFGPEQTVTLPPAGQQVFHFEAQAGDVLHLDILEAETNAGSLSIVRPDGGVERTNTLRDTTRTLDRPGRYTLILDADLDETAPVPIRFRATLGTQEIFTYTPGTTTTAMIDTPGERHIHHFSLGADTRVALSGDHVASLINWVLRSREGTVASGFNLNAADTPELLDLEAGEYWFTALGQSDRTGSYSFRVGASGTYSGTPTTRTVQMAALGEDLTGTLTASDEIHRYDFTLPAATDVILDMPLENPDIEVLLEGATAQLFEMRANRYQPSTRYAASLRAGDYSLTVRPTAEAAGDYRLRLLDLLADAQPMTPGTTLTVDLQENHAIQIRTVDLEAGERLFFDGTSVTGPNADHNERDMEVEVFGPDGRLIADLNDFVSSGEAFVAPQDGAYRLEFRRDDNNRLTYEATLYRASPEPVATSLGSVVDADIDFPGRLLEYEFDIATPTSILVDLFESGIGRGNLRFDLVGPDGAIVTNQSINLDPWGRHFSVAAGKHILRVYANTDETGSARIRLLDDATAPLRAFGEGITGTLNPGEEALRIAIDAKAGQRISVDFNELSGQNTFHSSLLYVVGPDGADTVRTGNTGTDTFFEAERDGRYLIILDPREGQSAPMTYDLTLRDATRRTVPLEVGAQVDGSFPVIFGEVDHSFTLAEGALLYLDALNNAPVRWTVLDAQGLELSLGTDPDLDDFNNDARFFRLPPGEYFLRLSPRGNATPDYSFVLRNLSESTELPFDQDITITSAGDGNAIVRHFDLAGLEQVYLDGRSYTGDAYWMLFDPQGNRVSWAFFRDDMTYLTRVPGRYTLVIDERANRDDGFETTFRVTKAVQRSAAMTPGVEVSGIITNPMDEGRHTFTLTNQQIFRFDGLSDNPSLHWRIERNGLPWVGPVNMRNGSFVLSRLDLPPGDYEVVITASGSATGDYAFNLIPHADAIPLAGDVSTPLIRTPGREARLFTYSGTSGQVIEFDVLSHSGNKSFAIYDPDGNRIVSFNSLRDVSDILLRKTGTYTVMVSGYGTNASDSEISYAFVLRETGNQAPETLTGTQLTVGETVSGTIPDPATPQSYVLTLNEPTRILIDGQTNLNQVNIRVHDRFGQVAIRRINQQLSQPYDRADQIDDTHILELAAGTYRFDVEATSGSRPYAFRLLDGDAGASLTLGETETVLLSPGNAMQVFTIDAVEGEHVALDLVSEGDFQYYSVLAPDGTELSDRNLLEFVSFQASQTGRYLLIIDGHAGNSVPRTVSVTRLSNAAQTIELNDVAMVELPRRSATDRFTFTLDETKTLYLDNRFVNSKSINWTIRDTQAREVAGARIDNAGSRLFTLPQGTYELSYVASGDFAPFGVRLLDLSVGTPITLGDPIMATEPVSSDRRVFHFEGRVGQELILDRLAVSTHSIQVQLVSPDGRAMPAQSIDDLSPMILDATGTWHLIILPPHGRDDPLTYEFRLFERVDDTHMLDFGVRRNDTPPDVRGRLFYSMTMPEAGEVYFDALLNDSDAWWVFRDAMGRRIGDASRFSTDGGDISRQFLAAGEYTLEVARSDDQITELPFRLLRFAETPQITPGAPVEVLLDPGSLTRAYRFDGEAGQRFKIALGQGRVSNVSWRLIAPDGREIFAASSVADLDTFSLAGTGEYVLLSEGRAFLTDPVTLSLNLIETPRRAAAPASSASRDAPDLVPSNVTVAAAGPVQAGNPLTVSWTVNNAGESSAIPGRDRVILRRVDTGEIVGVRVTPPGSALLGPGDALTRQAQLSLPSGALGAGDLVAEVELDIANAVNETSGGLAREANNLASVSFVALNDQLPDLVVENIRADPAGGYAPGQTVTVHWTLRNAGEATVTQTFADQVRIRNLSQFGAPTIDLQSLVYDPGADGTVPPNGTVERTLAFVWPDGIAGTGLFGFEVTTDLDQQVQEGNDAGTAEDNNQTQFDLISAPDLTIADLAMDADEPQAGDSVTFSWTVRNTGNADVPVPFRTLLVLRNESDRSTLLNQRIDFPEEAGTVLPAGAERQRSFTVQLPEGRLGVGNMQFRLFLDNGSATSVIEVNADGDAENNNATVLDFVAREKIYPDLFVTNAPSVTGAPVAGGVVRVDWRTSNTGDDLAGARTDRVVLSVDDTFGNEDDIVLGSVERGQLEAGATDPASLDVTLPGDLEGAFKLAIITDSAATVIEGDNEANNTSPALPLTVTAGDAPDLVVEAVAGPTAASWGDVVPLSWRVANQGTQATDSDWSDRLYLSQDAVLDAGDTLLAEVSAPRALAPGQSYTNTTEVTVPGGLTGAWRLIVLTDGTSTQNEGGNEGNNATTGLEPVTISAAPAADLVVSEVEGPAEGSPGDTATVTWRVGNPITWGWPPVKRPMPRLR